MQNKNVPPDILPAGTRILLLSSLKLSNLGASVAAQQGSRCLQCWHSIWMLISVWPQAWVSKRMGALLC